MHAVEVQHQRRLARPVRPEEGDPLAALDAQVHAEEGLVAVGVRERQPRDLEGRDRHQAQYPDIASSAAATAGTRATDQVAVDADAVVNAGIVPV